MQYLKECQLFQGISEEHVKLLVPYPNVITLERNDYIFREGETGAFIYSVGTGRVAMEMKIRLQAGGSEELATLDTLGPTEAFGLWGLVPPFVCVYSARALLRSTLLRMDANALREAMTVHPELGYLIMTRTAEGLMRRLGRVRDLLAYQMALRKWSTI